MTERQTSHPVEYFSTILNIKTFKSNQNNIFLAIQKVKSKKFNDYILNLKLKFDNFCRPGRRDVTGGTAIIEWREVSNDVSQKIKARGQLVL